MSTTHARRCLYIRTPLRCLHIVKSETTSAPDSFADPLFKSKLLDFGFDSSSILSFFRWSQRHQVYHHPLEHLCRVLVLLVNDKKYPKVRSLLLDFVKNGKTHTVSSVYHTLLTCSDISVIILLLLTCVVKEGKFEVGELVYKDMIRRRIKVNAYSFNVVINGLDVMEDMKVRGIVPNAVTYNTLIDGYCKRGGDGKMYIADALLREMVDQGVSLNKRSYNTLIDGFCKDDNVGTAVKVFKEMKLQGMRVMRPNIVTFNSLIDGLFEMIGLGLEPNIRTYNEISGFSKMKMFREAKELFYDIVKQVIDTHSKAGKMEKAVAISDLMLCKLICPNISTYNCLLGGYYRDGNVEAAKELLEEMVKKNAMCKRGESIKAVRLLDEMSEKMLVPSLMTFNSLMADYCQEGNPKAAVTIRKRMEKEGKQPNVVTYNVLIKGVCQKDKLEEANTLLNEMLEKGLVPNRITYDIIREERIDKGFVPDIDGHLYMDIVNC
ncbi:unnamed protein product [Withania somnifera]